MGSAIKIKFMDLIGLTDHKEEKKALNDDIRLLEKRLSQSKTANKKLQSKMSKQGHEIGFIRRDLNKALMDYQLIQSENKQLSILVDRLSSEKGKLIKKAKRAGVDL